MYWDKQQQYVKFCSTGCEEWAVVVWLYVLTLQHRGSSFIVDKMFIIYVVSFVQCVFSCVFLMCIFSCVFLMCTLCVSGSSHQDRAVGRHQSDERYWGRPFPHSKASLSLAQYSLASAESWPLTPFIHFIHRYYNWSHHRQHENIFTTFINKHMIEKFTW